MKKFTFKGVLDGFRSTVQTTQERGHREIEETLKPTDFTLKKVSKNWFFPYHKLQVCALLFWRVSQHPSSEGRRMENERKCEWNAKCEKVEVVVVSIIPRLFSFFSDLSLLLISLPKSSSSLHSFADENTKYTRKWSAGEERRIGSKLKENFRTFLSYLSGCMFSVSVSFVLLGNFSVCSETFSSHP